MISLRPIARALVPVDSSAAERISAPNYDEFQSDAEVWRLIQRRPDSVLRVTMAHCDAPTSDALAPADSDAALARASANMRSLSSGPLVRELRDILFVYEITGPARPGVRQVGLGGMAETDQIRTSATPLGPIIRNEGVREAKARGRARLIEATETVIGTVNVAIPDIQGFLAPALESHADARTPDLAVGDELGNTHRVWLLDDPREIQRLTEMLAREPEAYVADGNHRSAAAAMLGRPGFLAVFFPASRMGIGPYNRLVSPEVPPPTEDDLGAAFEVAAAPRRPYQPDRTHRVGLYLPHSGWLRLTPPPGTFDPADAAASIDHAIVQRLLFAELLGITDPADARLVFVGANRGAAWLQGEVDAGHASLAMTLPAVTMDQFVAVCHQDRLMPPKSTWFEPKIRSGLVMAVLGEH